jgi:hypothetical protein
VPEISRFYGIVVRMYPDDHPPPHFHAEYGSFRAVIDIGTLAVVRGKLPPRALGLLTEWAAARQEDLVRQWQRAANLQPLERIPPLD